jgi:DNA-binding SARP family transcriptional activator
MKAASCRVVSGSCSCVCSHAFLSYPARVQPGVILAFDPATHMFRLTTFGAVALESDHGPLARAALRRLPLALLAFAGAAGRHGVSRDKVLAFLWPERDLTHARNCLKQVLFVLRHELGRELFLPGGGTLRLDALVITADCAEFERAREGRDHRQMVDLYRGPFLDGFHLSGVPEFERWTEAERERTAYRYQAALEALAAEAECAGDPVEMVRWWRRLAAHDPLSSRIAKELVRALMAADDPAGARRRAALHERLLCEELGGLPDAAWHAAVARPRSAGL